MAENVHSRRNTVTGYLAVGIWFAYSVFLFVLINFKSWGMIHAGIGEIGISGVKVGFLSLLPYIGITYLTFKWVECNTWAFFKLTFLLCTMVLIGPVSYVYLLHLHALNPMVHPNNTWIYFSFVSGAFLILITILYLIRRFPDSDVSTPTTEL
jgi:hypothetical protein